MDTRQRTLDHYSALALQYAEENGDIIYDWEIREMFHIGDARADDVALNMKNVSSLPVTRLGKWGITKIERNDD